MVYLLALFIIILRFATTQPDPLATLQAALLVLLPVIMPYVGTEVAAIVRQRHFNPTFNEGISWAALLACTALNAFAAHQLTPGLFQGSLSTVASNVGAVLVGGTTLLLAGPLSSLKPWLTHLGWVESNIFNIVKPGSDPQATMPAIKAVRASAQSVVTKAVRQPTVQTWNTGSTSTTSTDGSDHSG
jgi:hypothetical protein